METKTKTALNMNETIHFRMHNLTSSDWCVSRKIAYIWRHVAKRRRRPV